MKIQKISMITAIALLLSPGIGSAADGLKARVVLPINRDWKFQRQAVGGGMMGSYDRDPHTGSQVEPEFEGATEIDYDDRSWSVVTVPHTWNAHDVFDAEPGYFRGIGWYRKSFTLPPGSGGYRVTIAFEAVNQRAAIWINGSKVGDHTGGYTGFQFDITDLVRPAPESNLIVVKADNIYDPDVAPTVKSDINFYGGIYRDVYLVLYRSVHIDDLFIHTPEITVRTAKVSFDTRLINFGDQPASLQLVHRIMSADGDQVGTEVEQVKVPPTDTLDVTIQHKLADPSFWSPSNPYLYQVRSEVRSGGTVLDDRIDPLGLRWYRFDPNDGFFLNGRPLKLQGTCWHQVYPGLGNALPNSRHLKDMKIIKEMGANFWRTSHYPHDPVTLAACDSLGIMVVEELPIMKEVGDVPAYTANILQRQREMVLRDRNHPSIILWGLAGEVSAPNPVAFKVAQAVADGYRGLDPTRPVAMHRPRGANLEALMDVVGSGADARTDSLHKKFPERRFMELEYSASLTGRGIYGGGRYSEEEACRLHEEYLAKINSRDYLAGGCIWHQFDYNGNTYDRITPRVTAFGLGDIWRIPKDVFYFYKSQWSDSLTVHIAGHWTRPGGEGQEQTIKVHSNGDEVALNLNGRDLGPGQVADIPGLKHPPLTWKVPYQPGTLTATATRDGATATDTRRTAGSPVRIELTADMRAVDPGDPEQLVEITASIVDSAGVVVPNAVNPISFAVFGPARVLPQTWIGHGTGTTWNAVAGMTRALVQPLGPSGNVAVMAASPGLITGRTRIRMITPGEFDHMEYYEGPQTQIH
ncbi:glycoside hydrolase family 2 TIM barrel-domain containing protein [candidate division KSB1 bacterium]